MTILSGRGTGQTSRFVVVVYSTACTHPVRVTAPMDVHRDTDIDKDIYPPRLP